MYFFTAWAHQETFFSILVWLRRRLRRHSQPVACYEYCICALSHSYQRAERSAGLLFLMIPPYIHIQLHLHFPSAQAVIKDNTVQGGGGGRSSNYHVLYSYSLNGELFSNYTFSFQIEFTLRKQMSNPPSGITLVWETKKSNC